MNIRENVSLATHSTMRLGGPARFLAEISSDEELQRAVAFAQEKELQLVCIGSGSNIVWTDAGFGGLVIVNNIKGFMKQTEDAQTATVSVGAGEIWDEFVARTVEENLSGIEALSLIPGTVGAAPVQNIGAYGQETSETIVQVRALDLNTHEFTTLENEACGFSYRHSIFNGEQKGRYLVSSVTFQLSKSHAKPPFYKDVDAYLEEHDIVDPTPQQLRSAVIAIRSAKLPDPTLVANNGSFFRNPIVDSAVAMHILTAFPDAPNWPMEQGRVKFSAAWLLEQAGFKKDHHDALTGMATWKNQALVLVNERAKTSSDVFAFADRIKSGVRTKFGIELQQEPETITE